MKISFKKFLLFLLLTVIVLIFLLLSYPLYCRYFEDHDRLLEESYVPAASVEVTFDSEDTYATLYNVMIARDGKPTLDCLMRIPKSEPPFAVMTLLGGLRTGKDAVRFIDHSGRAQEFIFISPDYPYSGKKDRIPPMEVIGSIPEIRGAVLDTHGAVSTIIDFTLTLPEADPDRVFITGVSFGSFFAVSSGSGDKRIKAVASLYGGGGISNLVTANLKFKPEWLRRIAGEIAGMLLRPVEPLELAGKIAPRHFLIVNGTGDERIPEEAATDLFEAAAEPKKLVWLGSEHFSKEQTELIRMLITLVGDWLGENELLH